MSRQRVGKKKGSHSGSDLCRKRARTCADLTDKSGALKGFARGLTVAPRGRQNEHAVIVGAVRLGRHGPAGRSFLSSSELSSTGTPEKTPRNRSNGSLKWMPRLS